MATDILKEFLVKLGYAQDEPARKKFVEGVETASAAVLKLGTIIETTALAVAVGVQKWAANLENLYFSSRRVGSSADALQAYALAARNFGASTDEALGSVENLAKYMREHYGGGTIPGWLRSFGLSADMSNALDVAKKLGQMFAKMRQQGNTPLASRLASEFGISDKTMLAMTTPGFAEELAAQEKRTQGWQKVTEAAHRFEIQLRNLKMQFLQMMLGFEGPAMAALQRVMTSFSRLMRDHGAQAIRDLTRAFDYLIAGMGRLLDWLDTHGDEIQKRITAMFKAFDDAYKIVKPALDFVYDAFKKLDEVTGGWSTNLAAVLLTLRALGATGLVTGVVSIAASLAKALAGAALGGAEGAGWAAAAGSAFGVAAVAVISGWLLGSWIYKHMSEDTQRSIGDTLGKAADALHPMSKAEKASQALIKYAGYEGVPNRSSAGGPVTNNNVTTNVTITGPVTNDKIKQASDAVERQVRIALLEAQIKREFLATVQ
jgi:hypothetical protein